MSAQELDSGFGRADELGDDPAPALSLLIDRNVAFARALLVSRARRGYSFSRSPAGGPASLFLSAARCALTASANLVLPAATCLSLLRLALSSRLALPMVRSPTLALSANLLSALFFRSFTVRNVALTDLALADLRSPPPSRCRCFAAASRCGAISSPIIAFWPAERSRRRMFALMINRIVRASS
jgi:hypothetical protein